MQVGCTHAANIAASTTFVTHRAPCIATLETLMAQPSVGAQPRCRSNTDQQRGSIAWRPRLLHSLVRRRSDLESWSQGTSNSAPSADSTPQGFTVLPAARSRPSPSWRIDHLARYHAGPGKDCLTEVSLQTTGTFSTNRTHGRPRPEACLHSQGSQDPRTE
jgi:hypothetical protein